MMRRRPSHALIAALLVASLDLPAALHAGRPRRGRKRAGRASTGASLGESPAASPGADAVIEEALGHNKTLVKKTDHWTVSDGGESCNATCAGQNKKCSEASLQGIANGEDISQIGDATGYKCNESLSFGYADFPKMDVNTGFCSYRRPWKYEQSCKLQAAANQRRFCRCGDKWLLSGAGSSCSDKCQEVGAACNEHAMEGVNTLARIEGIARSIGTPCSVMTPALPSEFPTQDIETRSCTYTYGHQGMTCDTTTGANEVRFCPCFNLAARGDPHLANIAGSKFDVVRGGISTLLAYPKRAEPQRSLLQVDASIEHPSSGSTCRGWFILRLWIRGSVLNETIQVSTQGFNPLQPGALGIKVGRTTYRTTKEVERLIANGTHGMSYMDKRTNISSPHLRNRIKFANLSIAVAGVKLEIVWSTGRNTPNSLDFRATHLSKIGRTWGGLLGTDNHTWVSIPDLNCNEGGNSDKVAELVAEEVPWTASASLEEDI